MSTAIVTITCPWCGGRVEGLRATNIDQTAKCPFCRTELHIPRIGEVVHERVVIREVAPVVDPDFGACVPSLRPRTRNPVAAALMVGLAIVAMAAVVCKDTSEMRARDDARDACMTTCETSCRSAGDDEAGKGYDAETERVMKEGDVLLCESRCQSENHCVGMSPHERERLLAH